MDDFLKQILTPSGKADPEKSQIEKYLTTAIGVLIVLASIMMLLILILLLFLLFFDIIT